MKDSAKNAPLWQQIRSKMPIDDNAEQDWKQMQSSLNAHLPVTHLSLLKRLLLKSNARWIISITGTSFIAALTLVIIHTNGIKHHRKSHRHRTNSSNSIPINPLGQIRANSETSDSLKGENINKDSTSKIMSTGAGADSGNHITNPQKIDLLPHNANLDSITTKTQNPATTGINDNQIDKAPTRTYPQNRNRLLQLKRHHSKNKSILGRARLIPSPGASEKSTIGRQNQTDGQQENITPSYPIGADSTTALVNPHPSSLSGKFNLNVIPVTGASKITVKPVNVKSKETKPAKNKGGGSDSRIEFGVFTGVNTSGSFTSKNQNSNFYGSSPVDVYFGLSGTYLLNNKWAISSGVSLLSPQNVTGSYIHANGSKADSGHRITINDSRKIYSVNIPVRIVYNITDQFHVIAGPVLSLPVKQLGGNSSIQPATISKDSAYYANTVGLLRKTKLETGIGFGLSGGVNYQVNRFIFEASYLKSIKGPTVTSGFGNYNGSYNTLQLSIGFRLNKAKKKKPPEHQIQTAFLDDLLFLF
jgi:hypothetical protein